MKNIKILICSCSLLNTVIGLAFYPRSRSSHICFSTYFLFILKFLSPSLWFSRLTPTLVSQSVPSYVLIPLVPYLLQHELCLL